MGALLLRRDRIGVYRTPVVHTTLIIPTYVTEEAQMTDRAATPWGLTRMKPFPRGPQVPDHTIVLDPETQTGRWLNEDGSVAPVTDKHKKSMTSKETRTRTSMDGNPDEGHDQESDTD